MRTFQFNKAKWSEDLDGTWISFLVKDKSRVLEILSDIKDKLYTCEIKVFRQKRSLNSNAYAWELMTELANVHRANKEEIYIEMLKRYGQIAEDAEGNKIIFSVKEGIDVVSFYKYVQRIGAGMVNGERFIHYKALKGSSEFDTREMSIFLDGIISDCQAEGIETRTPQEIQRMKDLWGKEN